MEEVKCLDVIFEVKMMEERFVLTSFASVESTRRVFFGMLRYRCKDCVFLLLLRVRRLFFMYNVNNL